jgi:hypothetical protein
MSWGRTSTGRLTAKWKAFISIVKEQCRVKLGPGSTQQKTEHERAESFGVGRCLLLLNPLRRSVPVALVSATTQRASHGLATRISYLFDGMRELVAKLADARLTEVAMSEWRGYKNSLSSLGLKTRAGQLQVGWTYMVSVIYRCTREIVGWHLSHRCRTEDESHSARGFLCFHRLLRNEVLTA